MLHEHVSQWSVLVHLLNIAAQILYRRNNDQTTVNSSTRCQPMRIGERGANEGRKELEKSNKKRSGAEAGKYLDVVQSAADRITVLRGRYRQESGQAVPILRSEAVNEAIHKVLDPLLPFERSVSHPSYSRFCSRQSSLQSKPTFTCSTDYLQSLRMRAT